MDNADLTDLEAIYARSVGQKPPIKFDVHVEGGPKAEQAFMDVCKLSQASGELIANLRESRRMLETAQRTMENFRDVVVPELIKQHHADKEALIEQRDDYVGRYSAMVQREIEQNDKLHSMELQKDALFKRIAGALDVIAEGVHRKCAPDLILMEVRCYLKAGEVAEKRVESSPTERPCCVEAYARGFDMGKARGEGR